MFKHIQIEVADTLNLSAFINELDNLIDQFVDAAEEKNEVLQAEIRNEIRIIESVIERVEQYTTDKDATLILDSHFVDYVKGECLSLYSESLDSLPSFIKSSIDWQQIAEINLQPEYADVFFNNQTFWVRCN